MFGEAGVSGSCDVNKWASRIEGVAPHNFAYIRNRAFAAPLVLKECFCRFPGCC